MAVDARKIRGPKTYPELFRALEIKVNQHISKRLGVADKLEPVIGQTLTQEEIVALAVRRDLLSRLKSLVRNKDYTKSNALNVLNIVNTVQYIMSVVALEAYNEGRKEIARWMSFMIEDGKLEFTRASQRHLRNILSRRAMLKMRVTKYLKKNFPDESISLQTLHLLRPALKNEGRVYLRKKLKGEINLKDIMSDVFRKPRRSSAKPNELPYYTHI